jgi:hypothetical protein
MLATIGRRAFGAVLAAVGGGVGAVAGAGLQAAASYAGVAKIESGALATALGVFGALMTAMAWIDHRIDQKFDERAQVERAENDKWRANLLLEIRELRE